MKERWYALNGWSVVILELDHENKTAQIRGYDVEGTKVKDCDYLPGMRLLLDVDYDWKLMKLEMDKVKIELTEEEKLFLLDMFDGLESFYNDFDWQLPNYQKKMVDSITKKLEAE